MRKSVKYFFYQIKRVKFKEILQVWKLPVAAVCALLYRRKHKDLWIVCEDKNEARDNGYWFFRYLREEHPEQECVYAICHTSPDFEKINTIGSWVEFGSLRHWILYLASSKKISSQKAGNPNAAIFYFLEVGGFLKDKRIFLQHGVTINDQKWLYYKVTKMKRFVCGAYPEYMYIKDVFGYPKENIVYTGFCRFDGLHDGVKAEERTILIMPTWREGIADEDERLLRYEGTTQIEKTNYFVQWTSFLRDSELQRLAKTYHCRFLFFPHRNMQKYMEFFPVSNEYLEIGDAGKYDVQTLLKGASMLVTDYSSVFMDVLYMKKPVIFYQFDYDMFRRGQYQEGYFSYQDNPFAESFWSRREVLAAIEKCIKSGFTVSEGYMEAHRDYFRLYDTNNCQRTYEVVQNL